MTTIRVAERKRFTQVDRECINDTRLSFRARGILFWLLDKPDNWRSDSNAIAHAGTEGRDAVRNALTELELAGYLKREKTHTEGGQWITVVTVYESTTKPQVAPTTEKPASVNRASARRASVFQASSLKTETNTDKQISYAKFLRPDQKHECDKCVSGWVEGLDGIAARCANAGGF